MKQICSHLEEQYQEFDDLVSGLGVKLWQHRTPFYNWTIFDQVAHIAFFDHEALLAIQDPDRFRERAEGVMDVIVSGRNLRAYTFNQLLNLKLLNLKLLGLKLPGLKLPDSKKPESLLLFWQNTRKSLIKRLNKITPKDRMPWYGPDMSGPSFVTGRLMEAWSHSQDVFDALRIRRINCTRLVHVAHIGVKTFNWSFILRKLQVPGITPRVELTGPSGKVWKWGEPDAMERVWGSAEEFCLVVTQRRNVLDTGLKSRGKNVAKWLTIAQAFAGVPQEHPAPGVRKVDYK